MSASSSPPPPCRGSKLQEIHPWERQVVEMVARAFPWYGYNKIALICEHQDGPGNSHIIL